MFKNNLEVFTSKINEKPYRIDIVDFNQYDSIHDINEISQEYYYKHKGSIQWNIYHHLLEQDKINNFQIVQDTVAYRKIICTKQELEGFSEKNYKDLNNKVCLINTGFPLNAKEFNLFDKYEVVDKEIFDKIINTFFKHNPYVRDNIEKSYNNFSSGEKILINLAQYVSSNNILYFKNCFGNLDILNFLQLLDVLRNILLEKENMQVYFENFKQNKLIERKFDCFTNFKIID